MGALESNITTSSYDNNFKGISIFPNPANEYFTFDFSNLLHLNEEKLSVMITSADGSIVYQEFISGRYLILKTGAFNNGLYFYRIMKDGKCISSDRFIILKN
jgi:hypothetical protein